MLRLECFMNLPPELRRIVYKFVGKPDKFVVSRENENDDIQCLARAVPEIGQDICREFISKNQFWFDARECAFDVVWRFAQYGTLKAIWPLIQKGNRKDDQKDDGRLTIHTSDAPFNIREDVEETQVLTDRLRARRRRAATRAASYLLSAMSLVGWRGDISFLGEHYGPAIGEQITIVQEIVANYCNPRKSCYGTKKNGVEIREHNWFPHPYPRTIEHKANGLGERSMFGDDTPWYRNFHIKLS